MIMHVSKVIVIQYSSGRLSYDAEHDLLTIAKFLVELTVGTGQTDGQTDKRTRCKL